MMSKILLLKGTHSVAKKKSSAKKPVAKKSPVKKSVKAPAKKSAPKKAAAKKAVVKKKAAPAKAKKAVVKKTAPAKKAAVVKKTAVAKKSTPAKKSPAVKAKAPVAAKAAVTVPAAKAQKTLDLSNFVTPLDDRLLVQTMGSERMTAGGLYIPDTVADVSGNLHGVVVSVGRGRMDKKGHIHPMDVQLGDKVVFAQYSGSKINIQNEDLIILRESEVMGVVSK
jgi:Co-chaperonin GroES (HSP10)